jgi:hydrogenase-4 membrane subunit HyfE
MNRRRAGILVVSIVATFVVLRAALQMSPESDFNVLGHNVHHLFTGLLLIVAGGIPLALFPGRSLLLDIAAGTFGAGLGLALDEWVYLIATDGTNASYLLPVSLKGGMIMIALAVAYIGVLYIVSGKRQR